MSLENDIREAMLPESVYQKALKNGEINGLQEITEENLPWYHDFTDDFLQNSSVIRVTSPCPIIGEKTYTCKRHKIPIHGPAKIADLPTTFQEINGYVNENGITHVFKVFAMRTGFMGAISDHSMIGLDGISLKS